jgi:hypothetical protein
MLTTRLVGTAEWRAAGFCWTRVRWWADGTGPISGACVSYRSAFAWVCGLDRVERSKTERSVTDPIARSWRTLDACGRL